MKKLQFKLGMFAILLAFFADGFTNVSADEYWTPDKQTGVPFDPNTECRTEVPVICGLVYEDNSEIPYDEVDGEYTGR